MFSGANPCLNVLKAIGRRRNGFICYYRLRVKLESVFCFLYALPLNLKEQIKKQTQGGDF